MSSVNPGVEDFDADGLFFLPAFTLFSSTVLFHTAPSYGLCEGDTMVFPPVGDLIADLP
jgi:hypothetical protein